MLPRGGDQQFFLRANCAPPLNKSPRRPLFWFDTMLFHRSQDTSPIVENQDLEYFVIFKNSEMAMDQTSVE